MKPESINKLKKLFAEDVIPNTTHSAQPSTTPMEPRKLSPEIASMFTERIADEFTAHYFYMCAGNYCNNAGYFKAGKFFLDESMQELDHARGLQDYLIQWNIYPTISQVQTQHDLSGLVDIINKSYELEYNLFVKYNDNSKSCFIKDPSTYDFLEKYREIQNQSVAEYSDLLNVLKLINVENKFDLLYFENNYFK